MSAITAEVLIGHEGPGIRDLVKKAIRVKYEADFKLTPPQLSEIILENSVQTLELSDGDLLQEIFIDTEDNKNLVLTPPHDEDDQTGDFVRDGPLALIYWHEIRQNQKKLESQYSGPMTENISEQFKDIARGRALETLRTIYAARSIQPTLNQYFGLKTASPPQFHSIHEKFAYLRAIKLTAEGVREFSL